MIKKSWYSIVIFFIHVNILLLNATRIYIELLVVDKKTY